MRLGESRPLRLIWQELPWWREGLFSVVLARPSPLDCSDELTREGPTVVLEAEFHPPKELGIAKYGFSRVAFSIDGEEAFVFVTMLCGDLCATGSSTMWRRENGRWTLQRNELIWLS